MSDMIASARAMTTVAEGQYNTLGLPKGSLTPATITAMVGFKQGKGLQVAPDITAAISKLQSHSMGVINGAAPGMSAALAAAGITQDAILSSTDTAGTVANIKAAAAGAGIMIDTATEQSMTASLGATTALSSFSSQMLAGGPAGFMQKFNQARAHISDAIELKKVTSFCSNVSLESFGSGISKISDLADQGMKSSLGDLSKVGDCMAATGKLFDMKDMESFGKPAGMIAKMFSSKMGNATGIKPLLKQVGVDENNLNDPVYAGQIDKAMARIKDPKILNAVAEQFEVKLPTGALPTVGTKNLTDGLKSAAAANPFSGLPSAGPDNSINDNAAASLLSRTPSVEPSSNPQVWGGINDAKSFGSVAPAKPDADTLKKIEELLKSAAAASKQLSDITLDMVNSYYAIDTKAADADTQMATLRASLKAKYESLSAQVQAKLL